MNYLFLDLETTGLYYKHHQIIEVAIMDMSFPFPKYSTYVKLEHGAVLTEEITELTGIAESDLDYGRPLAEVKKEIESCLKGNVVVCHNASFDLGFLHDIELPDFYCTRTMAHLLLPNEKSYRLKHLCISLGMGDFKWHRAVSDAEATRWLFKDLLSKFGQSTIEIYKNKLLDMKDRPIMYIPKHGLIINKM